MPHATVKLLSGRSEAKTARIAEAVAKAVMTGAECDADAVSISIEDVAPTDWVEQVFKPDIIGKAATLYKKPGYDPRRVSLRRTIESKMP